MTNAEIKALWVESGGSRHLDPLEISETGFWLFVGEMEIYAYKHATATADLIALREAFKAGWRTNATTEQPADYLDGCELVDWLEFQARGLAGYLRLINPEAAPPNPLSTA